MRSHAFNLAFTMLAVGLFSFVGSSLAKADGPRVGLICAQKNPISVGVPGAIVQATLFAQYTRRPDGTWEVTAQIAYPDGHVEQQRAYVNTEEILGPSDVILRPVDGKVPSRLTKDGLLIPGPNNGWQRLPVEIQWVGGPLYSGPAGSPGQPPAEREKVAAVPLGTHRFPNEIRTCWRHGFDTRDHFVKVWIEVRYPDDPQKDEMAIFRNCAACGAAGAVVAACATDGAAIPAAKAAFIVAFKGCLYASLAKEVVDKIQIDIKWKEEHGDWSGHH